jgi:hypothetical protein
MYKTMKKSAPGKAKAVQNMAPAKGAMTKPKTKKQAVALDRAGRAKARVR